MSLLIPGYHGAVQSIPAGRDMVKEVWIAEGKSSARARKVLSLAEKHGIPVVYKSRSELDRQLRGIRHQGFAVVARDFEYMGLEGMVVSADASGQEPLFVVADHITDAGNLASIVRTSAFFGVSGLIIARDRSASISPMVLKRSVGCHLYLPVSRVVNLARALDFLRHKNYWIIGAAGEADKSIYDYEWQGPTALVVGNEEKGLSRAVRKKCHELFKIPSPMGLDSLNVAVATGIILAEIMRQRKSWSR